MSFTDPHLSHTYEFDLEVGKGMSLNVTFNGDWENRVIVRNITCDKEIGRISGKLGTEGTLTYDNPHQCTVKIQCVFEHCKPTSVQWEKDKYIIREDHPTFKKIGCEDGGDENFTDLVMFVCITQKENSCMSNENCPPCTSECQSHLAGIVKVSTQVIGKPEIDVEDTESIKLKFENTGPCELTIEGIALSQAIYSYTDKNTGKTQEFALKITTLSPSASLQLQYSEPTLLILYSSDPANIKVHLGPGKQQGILEDSKIFTRILSQSHPRDFFDKHVKLGSGKLSLIYKLSSITITGTDIISNQPDDENKITVNKE